VSSNSKSKAQEHFKRNLSSRQQHFRAADLVAGVLNGDRNALSTALTLLESSLPEHRTIANEILTGILPHTGKSLRIGITGVPGVGKSTFIEAFAKEVFTHSNHKIAVLSVDPSSPLSKGSILGDKTRMNELSVHPRAFVRPSPSATQLGGVARNTRESILLCEAAGFDLILVETVGVGQSEVAVHGMTDFFLLLMLAGAGDQLQGIKRGIMELTDAMVITKADSGNEQAATRAKGEYASALHLFPERTGGWVPKVFVTSALQANGLSDVWEELKSFQHWAISSNYLHDLRAKQNIHGFHEYIGLLLNEQVQRNQRYQEVLKHYLSQLEENQLTPFAAAELFLSEMFKSN